MNYRAENARKAREAKARKRQKEHGTTAYQERSKTFQDRVCELCGTEYKHDPLSSWSICSAYCNQVKAWSMALAASEDLRRQADQAGDWLAWIESKMKPEFLQTKPIGVPSANPQKLILTNSEWQVK